MIAFKGLSRRKPVVNLELSFFTKVNVIKGHIYKLRRFSALRDSHRAYLLFSGSLLGVFFSTSHLLTLNLRHLWGVYCKRISFKGRCLFTNTHLFLVYIWHCPCRKFSKFRHGDNQCATYEVLLLFYRTVTTLIYCSSGCWWMYFRSNLVLIM